MLGKIRKTVRVLRKSSLALFNLNRQFDQSFDFKKPLPLILDVKNRCGSTLAMCKRYMKIKIVIEDDCKLLIHEMEASSGDALVSLFPSEVILIKLLIKLLQSIEDITALFIIQKP